ncbi:GNAT family N-acetyltransferase [Pontibacter sp. KCTC 32443]|uniref:GNAT family N-acetyltransferase n=1 Tax=Pontibacter TaxID=323449 RepID=UPI00164E7ABE|nr:MULTISPECIES: GNAT family protein [Pontibacter]MBC5774027.1 GNAT family N-acetyltransferase [Pontibacter sp. KCTC 32443]
MSLLFNILPDSLDEKLETDHLILRPYQEGDENDFMRVLQENSHTLYPAFSGRIARVKALEDARIQMQQLRTDWDNRKTFDFGVWAKADNNYLGDIALKNVDHKIPKAEIGLYFSGWPETKELVQEALQSIIRFAFDALHLNKVYIRCTTNNKFYGELALENGFVEEGTLRSDFRGLDSNELHDLTYFGMTRKDFESIRQQHSTELV